MFWRFDTFHLIETTYGSISVGVICQAARLSAQMLQTRRANVKFFTEMQQCFCFRFAVFRMAPARAASFVFKYI